MSDTLEIHENFSHDTSDFPETSPIAGRCPYDFEKGTTKLVPDEVPKEIADYFIRAGWACYKGSEVVKPDHSKPVLVQPDKASSGTKSTGP